MYAEYIKNLPDLCRICGEKFTKSKGSKLEASHLCSKNVQFIQLKFSMSMQKDVKEVYPPRFCKRCRLTNSHSQVFSEPIQEEECKTYNLATVGKREEGLQGPDKAEENYPRPPKKKKADSC